MGHQLFHSLRLTLLLRRLYKDILVRAERIHCRVHLIYWCSRSCRCESFPHPFHEQLKSRKRGGKSGLLNSIQALNLLTQETDPASATLQEQSFTLGCGGNSNDSPILRIICFDNKLLFLQGVHHARHGWRSHLFRLGEFAQSDRAAVDNYRKSGQSRRGGTARLIHPPHRPQQPYGCRVKLPGEPIRIAFFHD